MKISPITRTIQRRLNATDARGRPYFIAVHPNGVVEVWPRRHPREQTTVKSIYETTVIRRKLVEQATKKERNGKPARSTRR